MIAWIGLGANLGDPVRNIYSAISLLRRHPGIRLESHSSLYRSEPWGMCEQPAFVNAVARVETRLEALQLLATLLDVERELGRTRAGLRWGPRVIDLDLLSHDNLVLQSTRLELPHPRMHQRVFVLLPLLELDPHFEIPGLGRAADCLARIEPRERRGVTPLAPTPEDPKR
ncbi:MAG: 2-amino-4-hydroxy-6-hydroxymethyldihydropteridine diphosphokinase [Xanthomonadales bacterium]|nr:2-amino-4-hydroxy-6-hydroxymethyldihydropteridine diphosphokinase [Xanthomonadales bacterium]